MKNREYKKAKALVSNGLTVAQACARAGLSTASFYTRRATEEKNSDGPQSAPSNIERIIDACEPSLEEQVIASDLSAKAKVKILSTLLNG